MITLRRGNSFDKRFQDLQQEAPSLFHDHLPIAVRHDILSTDDDKEMNLRHIVKCIKNRVHIHKFDTWDEGQLIHKLYYYDYNVHLQDRKFFYTVPIARFVPIGTYFTVVNGATMAGHRRLSSHSLIFLLQDSIYTTYVVPCSPRDLRNENLEDVSDHIEDMVYSGVLCQYLGYYKFSTSPEGTDYRIAEFMVIPYSNS